MDSKKQEIPLGQLLIKEKKITNEQLLTALEEQRKTGDKLGHTLIKLGYISEDDLIKILEHQFGIPAIKINSQMLNPLIVKLIPENICRQYRLCPIILEENKLTVAAANPYDLSFIDKIKFTTDYNIEVLLCTEKSILDAINYCFGKKDYDWQDIEEEHDEDFSQYKISASQLLDIILNQAYHMSAREIQLEFFEEKFNILFITRSSVIKGKPIPDSYFKPISFKIKRLANLDSNPQKFVEGIFKKKIMNKEFMIRVLVFPTQPGENIVLKFP